MYKILKNKSIDQFLVKLKKINPYISIGIDDMIFVIIIDNITIGYAIISKNIYLKDIFIEINSRYQSYGLKLIEYVKNYLAINNKNELYLDKYLTNTAFFKKVGFVHHSENLYIIDNLTKSHKRKKEGINSTVISILINIILATIKITFGIIGKSKALVADGFHSLSDIIGSFVVLIGIYLGNIPADEDHPYGHGKLESIAGTIIGIILIITAYTIIVGDFIDFFRKTIKVVPEKITILIVIISIVVKFFMYKWKERIGIRLKSDAILADAKDHKTDVISSVAVLIGILLSIYINPIFDLILSIVVGIIIAKEGLSIIFHSANIILDVQDKEFINQIKIYTNSFDFVKNCHDIRMKTSGNLIFLSLHIRLDKDLTLHEGHEFSDSIKYSILNQFQNIKDITIHLDCSL